MSSPCSKPRILALPSTLSFNPSVGSSSSPVAAVNSSNVGSVSVELTTFGDSSPLNVSSVPAQFTVTSMPLILSTGPAASSLDHGTLLAVNVTVAHCADVHS